MVKAQIKIQQMAFMLLAVTLFFILVGMLLISVGFSGVKKSAIKIRKENALLLVTKLANSPEFACGSAFGSNKINCIDADKIMMLKENIQKYSNFWGVDNIEVKKVYPKSKRVLCSLENYPNCDTIQIYSKNISGNYISNFVALCRKDSLNGESYNKCELAKIMVSYKLK